MLTSDHETADRAIRATLSTLGERVGADAGWALAARLAATIDPLLYAMGPAISFDAEEFVYRVGQREDVDRATAELHVATVLAVLAHAIDDREYGNLVSRLSGDFAPLLPRGHRNPGPR